MVAFITILAELERSREESGAPLTPLRVCLMEPILPKETDVEATVQAIAAYQSIQAESTALAEQDRFAQLLSEARHSPQALKALRRQSAWRLHPDRSTTERDIASVSLSDVNAAIDAALTACSPSVRRG